MRIVSLYLAATETVVALGLADKLVGASHVGGLAITRCRAIRPNSCRRRRIAVNVAGHLNCRRG